MKLFTLLFITIVLSQASAAEENLCSGAVGAKQYAGLIKKQHDVDDAIQSTIKVIQSYSESEKVATRTYDISSSITYSLIGAGVTGGVAGLGINAIGGGAASLSLRLGGYVAGSTFRTNTVGIGAALMTGATIGGGGRAFYLFDGGTKPFKISELSYGVHTTLPKSFDPFGPTFASIRTEFANLQKTLAETKGANSKFNFNGTRELTRSRLGGINNFYLLQLLALEREAIARSLKYKSANCRTDAIFIDFDIEAEAKKTLQAYRNLADLDIEAELRAERERHKVSPNPTNR